MKITTVEVDARGRAALGKVATQGTYKASALANGRILLEPAKVYTEAELALRANPTALAELNAALAGEDLIPAKKAPTTVAA